MTNIPVAVRTLVYVAAFAVGYVGPIFFVGGDSSDAQAPTPVTDNSKRLIAGHRGTTIGGSTPENTIPAFKYADRNGADIIEFDVRLTGDSPRKMVVIHDASLDRTTQCHGLVRDRTLAAIKRCDTDGPGFVGPPSLRQTLQYAAAADADRPLYVELKDAWTQAQVQRFVDEIASYDLLDVTATSFLASNLHKVQLANDALPDELAGQGLNVGLITSGRPPADLDPICVMYNSYHVNLDYVTSTMTRNLQDACEPPTDVSVWGHIDTPFELELAYETGARVICAEDPKQARAWLAAR